jgi:endonuclease/exonuclease/phosphatase family metal-dependent hydrolase
MKVLSYNIQCDGSNYSERLVKILKFVKRENPDIISFQEVKYGSYKTILSKLKEYNCYLSNRVEYNRMYGEILLTKFEINQASYTGYDESPNIRGLTKYHVSDDIVILTTHLEHQPKYNKKQVSEIKKQLGNAKVILLGDFNFFDEEPVFELKDAGKELGNTFVSKKYKSRPDRIYYSGFNPLKYRIDESGLSDHKAIIAEFF